MQWDSKLTVKPGRLKWLLWLIATDETITGEALVPLDRVASSLHQ